MNLKVFSLGIDLEEVAQMGWNDKQLKDVDKDEKSCKHGRIFIRIHKKQCKLLRKLPNNRCLGFTFLIHLLHKGLHHLGQQVWVPVSFQIDPISLNQPHSLAGSSRYRSYSILRALIGSWNIYVYFWRKPDPWEEFSQSPMKIGPKVPFITGWLGEYQISLGIRTRGLSKNRRAKNPVTGTPLIVGTLMPPQKN